MPLSSNEDTVVNMIARALAAVGLLLGYSLALAEEAGRKEPPLEPWQNLLRVRFSECVRPSGLLVDLPVAAAPSDRTLAVIPLSTPGVVSDGYYHHILVDRPANVAYLVQLGGIAGGQTVFGPVRLDAPCLAHRPAES
jgi:hypothetical protein